MKRVLSFFLKYYLFWLIYFILFRVLFMLANFSSTASLTLKDILGAFFHGSIMDLSVAGYFTLLPGVLLVFVPFFKPLKGIDIIQKIIKGYTLFLLVVITMMGIGDIALYPAWGSRLNAQLLPYLSNPIGILSCALWWQIALFVFAEIVIVATSIFSYKKIFITNYFENTSIKWYTAPILLFTSAALILPIRGGIDTSPLNFSSVYFSETLYANHCAYNFFWSFNHAVLHNNIGSNPVKYMDMKICNEQMKGYNLLNQEQPPIYIHNKTGKPTNVIVVILESFSNKVIEPLGGLPNITPRLNQFCKEGILFSSFYSTGNRSDKGLSSLIGSYPALIKGSSILFFPDKMKKLDCMPTYFKKRNYNMSFYYGGDINFYNVRMLLIQSGISNIISRSDFPLKHSTMQKWGVEDQFLYQRMNEDLLKMPQPFFSMVYNISSHEPFDIKNFNRIKGNKTVDKYCNAIAYSDSCLGQFIDQLKKSTIWENTLVIITSDHTSLEPGPTTLEEPATYKIPLLWLGGVIDTAFVEKNIAMQTDLSPTLIQQMGWKPKASYFSKNIFGSKQYAFYFRDEGWGFLSPELGCFTNLESNKQNYFYGKNSAAKDSLSKFSRAFTQFLHDDFLKK